MQEADSQAVQVVILPVEESTSQWWASQRFRYNVGLAVAGITAFLLYAAIFAMTAGRIRADSIRQGGDGTDVEITALTTIVQGIGYLFMMGVANLFYYLGPISERIVRPRHTSRYRRITFRLGFWFSVALPFSIPLLLFLRYVVFW